MPSAQPPSHMKSHFSVHVTEYPDADAVKLENNRRETATGSGADVAITPSLERRRRDDLLTDWKKIEATLARHLTYIITQWEER